MTKLLASSLYNKKVVSSNGDELGKLRDVITNFQTGELKKLVVEPNMNVEVENFEEEDGFIFLPFDSVKAIKEVIVVE